MRCRGEMLSEVILPPAAPQPSVIEGNRFVVYPTAPRAAGVLTQMRNAGLRRPNCRTTSSSFVCRLNVWPRPPKFKISMHFAQPSCQSFTFYFNDAANTEIYTLSLHGAFLTHSQAI